MGLRDSMLAGLAEQLGHPSGLRGALIGSMLNRGNRRAITSAVEALRIRGGETAADIGFGGGLGLALLLDRVGEQGTVHGVDISTTMLARAERRFRQQSTAAQLHLSLGSITDLPLDDGSVDAAITLNTIYFVDDLDRAFSQLARVLSPAGRVVVGIGDPVTMGKAPFTAHGFRLRPVDEVTGKLEAAKLSLEDDIRIGNDSRSFHLLLARHA